MDIDSEETPKQARSLLGVPGAAEPASASILDDNLLGFSSGLARQDKQFVKNSTRYARSLADKRYNSVKQAADWFEYYSGILWSIGWGLDQPLVEVIDKKFSGSVTAAWLEVMSKRISRKKLEAIEGALATLEDDSVLQGAFAERVRNSGMFEILPVERNSDGTLDMHFSHVRLLKLNWSTGFWSVGHSVAQLDIRVRRFTIRQRDVEKQRQILQDAVDEMEDRYFAELISRS